MWPFSCNQKPSAVRPIRCGDVEVTWNSRFDLWEFSVGEIDYSFASPTFDPSVLPTLSVIEPWLTELDTEIDQEIAKHLDGWCDWKGEKDLVGIDVSKLVANNEVDVSYAHEDWADLGINIVIAAGIIVDSYAGD